MAYDKEQIINMALDAIEQHNCTRVSEVLLHLPISKTTFYDWKLDESDRISQKIEEQKIRVKAKMKRKWIDSDIPALAIAAFKLIADEEEWDKLNTTKTKNETKSTHRIIMTDDDGRQISLEDTDL